MFSRTLLPPPDPETTADARRAGDVAMLGDVAGMAHALAGAFSAKALELIKTADTPKDHAVAAAYGRSFDHSARTLRQTLALRDRFAEHKEAVRRKAAEARQAADHVLEVESEARRALVGAVVSTVIETARPPRLETENLLADLNERLDAYDDERFLNQPTGAIIQGLCRDLDLPLDLTLWQDQAWAKEEIQLRPKGSPFAGAWRMPPEPADHPAVPQRLDPLAQPP